MTLSKRSFLQLLAVQAASITLAACGGGGDDGTAGAGAGGGGAGGAANGALVVSGTSNLPDAATDITPNAGLPAGTTSSIASTSNNLLDGVVNSLVNNRSRTLSVPLAGTAPPALGSSYTVVADNNTGSGSVISLLVVEVLTSKAWFYFSESGTVKITAISATSAELLFTNVTLAADPRANNNSATGKVILNGTIVIKRV